jgi:hypothetical protein
VVIGVYQDHFHEGCAVSRFLRYDMKIGREWVHSASLVIIIVVKKAEIHRIGYLGSVRGYLTLRKIFKIKIITCSKPCQCKTSESSLNCEYGPSSVITDHKQECTQCVCQSEQSS